MFRYRDLTLGWTPPRVLRPPSGRRPIGGPDRFATSTLALRATRCGSGNRPGRPECDTELPFWRRAKDSMEDQPLRMLSAFTGLGGLDLGLESAGFESVGCIEWDADARRSLKANRSDSWPLIGNGDISEVAADLEPSDLGLQGGELTLLSGAPPCQPFSKAAQWHAHARKGVNDARYEYLIDFFSLGQKLAPQFLLLENVPGFLRGPTSAESELRAHLHSLSDATGYSYEASYEFVDTSKFGVPQRRRRVLVMITRSGEFEWPSVDRRCRTAWDAIGSPPNEHEVPEPAGRWSALLPSIPEGENYQWHTDRGGGRPLFGYRTRYWSFLQKLHRDRPSPTLAASPGPSTGPFHWDNRPLSVWEMLRLQTFPGTWRVEGDRRAQVRQIGNATPPLLAEIVGAELARQLGRDRVDRYQHDIRRQPESDTVLPVQDVPAEFMYLIGAHAAHPGTGRGPRPRIAHEPGQQQQD